MLRWAVLSGNVRAAGADPRLLPGTDTPVTSHRHHSRHQIWKKRLEAHYAGIMLALMLQGGNGLDKTSCFHPNYFSFKPSASTEHITKMMPLTLPPIPLSPCLIAPTVLNAAPCLLLCAWQSQLQGHHTSSCQCPATPILRPLSKRQSFTWWGPLS